MFEFAPGSTSNTIYFELRDASTAQPKLSLTPASSGAQAAYTRKGQIATSIPLVALGAPDAAWQAGGFKEIDSTLAPGLYRLDLPDASCAVGAQFVVANLAFTGTLAEAAVVLLRNPVNNVGAGAIAYTVTVENLSLQPLAGAQVWISTDVAGTNVIAGALSTNSSGQVTFLVNPGSYYLWVSDQGYTGTNPNPITVS